jgi:hypothetical protein
MASKNARAAFIDSVVDEPVSAPVAISEKLQERAGEMFDINNGKPEWHGVSTALRARWYVIETLRTLRQSDSNWPHEAYEHSQKKAFATALAELLPDRERTVLQQYFIDRRETEDIAAAISMSMPIKSQREKFVNEIVNRIIDFAKKRTSIDEEDLQTLLREAGEAGVTVLRGTATPSLMKPAPDNGFGKIGLEPEEIEALLARHIVTLTQFLRLRTNEFMKLGLPQSIWREIVAKMLIADKYFADGEAATMQLMGLKGQTSAPIVAPRETETRRESPAMYSRSGVALRVTPADYRDKLTMQNRPLGSSPRAEPARVVPKVLPAPVAKPSIAPVRPTVPPVRTAQIIPPQRRVEPPRERIVEAPPVRQAKEKPDMPKSDPFTLLGYPWKTMSNIKKRLGVNKPEEFHKVSSAEIVKKMPDPRMQRSVVSILIENEIWLADGEEATRNLLLPKSERSANSEVEVKNGSKKTKDKASKALVLAGTTFPDIVETHPLEVKANNSNGNRPISPMSIGDFFQAIGQGMKAGTITSQMVIGNFTFSEGTENYNMFVSIGKEKN